MGERFTILANHPRGILSREERDAGQSVLSDLQIDRAMRTVCPEYTLRDAFLSVLLTPLTDPEEIVERQRILRLFFETPELLDRLTEALRRVLMTKNSWDAERSRLMASRRVNPQDKSLVLWVARENLVLTAHFTRIILTGLRDFHETLNMFGAAGGWLDRLKQNVSNIAFAPEVEDLLAYTDKIEKGLPQAHAYTAEFECSPELRANIPFLVDFDFIPLSKKPDKPQRSGLFALFSKSSKGDAKEIAQAPKEAGLPEHHVPLEGTDVEWGLDTAARAVQESDRLLTSFLRGVVDRFTGLEEELYFYQCAVLYLNRFRDRAVRFVYPEILGESENTLSFADLSDFLLLTESMYVQSVIPNDVSYSKAEGGVSGMLVTGKNNSGKTVYLRSIGTAVLLAQCGLPVPAREAKISVRRRIFTTFARAEGELIPQSSAGRFEEEVAEIAEVIREMEPNSLLLLNETFQTTAYDEGAEGIMPILSYLSSLGCGFIFVTHLTRLIEQYKKEPGVTVVKTSDDPRTRYRISVVG